MIEQHSTDLIVPLSVTEARQAASALSEAEARQISNTVTFLQERMIELENALEGWERIDAQGSTEFSRDALKKIAALSRLMFLKNPLINRAVSLQAFYVFGQGVNVQATHPDVNEVVQAFLDDPKNQAELTSQQAREMKEQTLQVEGNLFFVLFANTVTGQVRVRTIPTDEIADIITNPDDARDHWYYRRTWTQHAFDPATGVQTLEQRIAYYPDWQYRPSSKPATIGGNPVQWTTPIYHVRVGGLDGMRFGVPETYAALDWARSYKSFLENWATIVQAYARFAFKVTTPGGARGIQAAKTRLATTIGSDDRTERNPPPVTASTFVAGAGTGADLTPVRTAGATTSAEDGRWLLLMVAAAMGLPEIFFGNADVGNHATAKTLDRPTELKFKSRQTLWSDVHQRILQYVVDQAVTAPQGLIQGTVSKDSDGAPVVTLANDPSTREPIDRHITIEFPPILEHDQAASVAAIVEAATLGGHPPVTLSPKLTTRLLLQALGIEDVDDLLAVLFPEPPESNEEEPDVDELSPSSSQAPKPEPPTPPVVIQPAQTGQQLPPGEPDAPPPAATQEAVSTPPAVAPADLGDPLPLNDAALERLSQVGPDDLAGAESMWREANTGHPEADLFDAKTDEAE